MFGSPEYKTDSNTVSVVEAYQWSDGGPRDLGKFWKLLTRSEPK